MEFVDKFGANMQVVWDQLDHIDDIRRSSDELYLDLEYDDSLAQMEEAIHGLREAGAKATALKDQVLFWIYFAEWLTVSGVSLISGVILWMLMIRRMVYRDVKITRYGPG
jgi:hypothetical protein